MARIPSFHAAVVLIVPLALAPSAATPPGTALAAAPFATDSSEPSQTVQDNLPSWLAGHWEGTGFGGVVEETWTPPRDGTMLGTFRLTVGGKVRLFEFMILSLNDGNPTIRVKHFNPDATGWEDRNEWVIFPFQRAGEQAVFFDGLSYELLGTELRVRVSVGDAEGKSEVAELNFRRAGG